MANHVVCPLCGSRELWHDDHGLHLCKDCDHEFRVDNTGTYLLFMILGLIAFGITFTVLIGIYSYDRDSVHILENNVYELPQVLYCVNGPIKAELGIQGQYPLTAVYPEIEGKNHWQISPETSSVLMKYKKEQMYLLMSCEGEQESEYSVKKKQVYFPMPQDGQLVTVRK